MFLPQHVVQASAWATPKSYVFMAYTNPNCHQGDHLASCCCLHDQDTDVLFAFSSQQPSRASTEQRNGKPHDSVLPDTLQRLQHRAAPRSGPCFGKSGVNTLCLSSSEACTPGPVSSWRCLQSEKCSASSRVETLCVRSQHHSRLTNGQYALQGKRLATGKTHVQRLSVSFLTYKVE